MHGQEVCQQGDQQGQEVGQWGSEGHKIAVGERERESAEVSGAKKMVRSQGKAQCAQSGN